MYWNNENKNDRHIKTQTNKNDTNKITNIFLIKMKTGNKVLMNLI